MAAARYGTGRSCSAPCSTSLPTLGALVYPSPGCWGEGRLPQLAQRPHTHCTPHPTSGRVTTTSALKALHPTRSLSAPTKLALTFCTCPVRCATCRPVAYAHTRALLSLQPAATRSPCSATPSALMAPPPPLALTFARCSPLAASHTCVANKDPCSVLRAAQNNAQYYVWRTLRARGLILGSTCDARRRTEVRLCESVGTCSAVWGLRGVVPRRSCILGSCHSCAADRSRRPTPARRL